MNAKKTMLRYVLGSIIGNIIELIIALPMICGLLGGVIWGLFSLIGELIGGSYSYTELVLVILIVLGVVLALRDWLRKLMPYFSYLYFLKTIILLKDTGMYNKATLDFSEAVPVLKDRIRMGKRWIFCKSAWIIIEYANIKNIHQYVLYINHFETNRELRIVDEQNRTRMLCKLKRWGNADDELNKVLRFMLYKNHDITVGYNRHKRNRLMPHES